MKPESRCSERVSKKFLMVLVLAGFALLFQGCNGGSAPPPPPPAATHFSVNASAANATAGTALNFTVSALDSNGNVVSSYGGTVHFTSSDPQALLPGDAPLNRGTGNFMATLKTAGSQTITVSDSSISGTSSAIAVSPGTAAALSVTIPSATSFAGTAFSFTVSAQDAFNNVASSYSGTVKFTSSDPQAALPGPSKLTNGTGSFSATFKTIGTQTIAATDSVTSSITGSSGPINVVSNAPATHFAISVPASATTRSTFLFSVTALDASNNTAVTYSGTVHFTSSDAQAHLPSDSALVNGAAQLSATLETVGNQTITAIDTAVGSLTGTSSAITASAASPLVITSGAPPAGVVGSGYNPHEVRVCLQWAPPPIFRCEKWGYKEEAFFALTASGGVQPNGVSWSWAAAPGFSLPPGLTLKAALISGTPPPGSVGTYNVIITVTDGGTPTASTSNPYSITIKNPPAPTLSLSPAPPGALVNQPFSFTFAESNGYKTLTWTESGALPPGLTFDPTNGTISGMPTATGSFPITVNVTDSLGQSTGNQPFTIEVFAHGFVPSGNMATARLVHAATLLSGGKVLVTGGQLDINTLYNTAEVFDPAAGTFSSAGTMSTSRAAHTATLLCDLSAFSCANKKVLIAGGESGSDGNAIGSAELYDPSAGTFTLTGSMVTPRYGHTATLLPDGKVLITGGTGTTQAALSSAELYDPSTGAFTSTGPMSAARAYHTATLLPNGKVLVAGGSDANFNALNSAELYDPTTGTFTPAPNMTAARSSHTATLLNTGQVLLAGSNGPSGNSLDSAELYDPSKNTFTTTGNLVTARGQHTAALLSDGTVLLAGGILGTTMLRNAELYNPTTGTFSDTGGLGTCLFYHAMTALSSNGLAIVIGGDGPHGALASTEVYQ